MGNSKNDKAWEILFDRHQILENIKAKGLFEIKSLEINKVREARLMTKFDYSSQLPAIFQENQLSILPNSRSSYLIGSFKAYEKFDTYLPPLESISLPQYIESIEAGNITSEAIAINGAFLAGIFEKFIEEEPLHFTVNGRMSSASFSFFINSAARKEKIYVQNAQLEIDAGIEGPESLALIEAKNSLSDDFLVRQLYYPYRLWYSKIKKRVRPISLIYTNGIFNLREYTFNPHDHYNGICLVKSKRYSISEGRIDATLLLKMLNEAQIVFEPEVPFPQADSFDRLVNLLELIHLHGEMPLEQISETYDFDPRQARYYTSAGNYLGLLYKKEDTGCFSLTENAIQIFKSSIFNRQLGLIKTVLSHVVFNRCLRLFLQQNNNINKEQIVSIMKEEPLYKIQSDSTYYRRAATILSWLNWMTPDD